MLLLLLLRFSPPNWIHIGKGIDDNWQVLICASLGTSIKSCLTLLLQERRQSGCSMRVDEVWSHLNSWHDGSKSGEFWRL